VLFVPGRPLKGPNAIKPFFQAFFSEFAKPGASFSMRQRFVEGDYAYILWSAETASKWRKHTCLWFKLKLIEDAFTPTAKKEIVSNLTDAMVWSTHNRGGDELTVVSSDYLEVIPVKA
jgi:hypothetical protein